MHLHDCRIVGNRDIVDDSDVLNVGTTEQDVVVDGGLGQNGILRFSLLRTERPHYKLELIPKGKNALLEWLMQFGESLSTNKKTKKER